MTTDNRILPNLTRMKKAELVALCEQMSEDWQTLNAIHNNRAANNGWCGEYEERQERYNTQFKVLRLLGRESGLRGAYAPEL